ncbi:hypothetical protein [Nocardiopsis halotolerans]|uniref:hypothetical protein n=1 Tax=Nocardiopsis halotolerans TaxID=124252 RepID=UPI000349D432
MRQFSAALLTRALGLVTTLFVPARGRHSAAARRRRSTRVRRYAPLPAPASAQASAPSTPPIRVPRPRRAQLPTPRPVPAPRLAPAPESFRAEDIALVRPYYAAHEGDLSRVQTEAAARPRAWSHRSAAPVGDLLAPSVPGPRRAEGVLV